MVPYLTPATSWLIPFAPDLLRKTLITRRRDDPFPQSSNTMRDVSCDSHGEVLLVVGGRDNRLVHCGSAGSTWSSCRVAFIAPPQELLPPFSFYLSPDFMQFKSLLALVIQHLQDSFFFSFFLFFKEMVALQL